MALRKGFQSALGPYWMAWALCLAASLEKPEKAELDRVKQLLSNFLDVIL